MNDYEWRDLAYLFNVVNLSEEIFMGCAWIDSKIDIARL